MHESAEMYLLRIALLRRDAQPVPLSLLAHELTVSSVSANEMSRKLMSEGLLTYEPYKGVTLTSVGEAIAYRILRRRRLWEVFLVEQLKLEPLEAEEIACRLEHVTPDVITERLAAFLEHPTYSPQHEPIPSSDGVIPEPAVYALSTLSVGERGTIAHIHADMIDNAFLRAQGMTPGVMVLVRAIAANGAVLLDLNGRTLAVEAQLAAAVLVSHGAGSDA